MRCTTIALGAFLFSAFAVVSATSAEREDFAASIDERVQACQPRPEEKRFDEIGWVNGILEAERIAKAHRRPVFLFTHDGRMAIGRC